MSDLEVVLNNDPGALQAFSAKTDFSGENVAFLTSTAKWKASCPESPDEAQKREAYSRALEIYTTFISPRDADLPLNLSSQHLKRLEDIFEKAARLTCGEPLVNTATPFDVETPRPKPENKEPYSYTGEIPTDFDKTVFDKAQTHIKYLVFTNTWPKFVKEQQRNQSSDAGRTGSSAESQTTLASWLSEYVTDFINSRF
ncbi:hypothetical protein QQZ08_001564 [Neonectria magnoliae]|uniref:RGS domain-containing protein n=1 Tax=Neonectria magnoliae TaxID=2732573 RepID=A0ABR1IFX1_9HYPO